MTLGFRFANRVVLTNRDWIANILNNNNKKKGFMKKFFKRLFGTLSFEERYPDANRWFIGSMDCLDSDKRYLKKEVADLRNIMETLDSLFRTNELSTDERIDRLEDQIHAFHHIAKRFDFKIIDYPQNFNYIGDIGNRVEDIDTIMTQRRNHLKEQGYEFEYLYKNKNELWVKKSNSKR